MFEFKGMDFIIIDGYRGVAYHSNSTEANPIPTVLDIFFMYSLEEFKCGRWELEDKYLFKIFLPNNTRLSYRKKDLYEKKDSDFMVFKEGVWQKLK